MKNIVISIEGKECPKCNIPMVTKKHSGVIKNPKFYFSQWDYCKWCKHVQFYEEFRCKVSDK